MDRIDRIEEPRGGMTEGVGASHWLSRRAEAEAERRLVGRGVPWLVPATFGCPRCGTARIIASPAPPGACERCGSAMAVLQD